MSAEEFGRRTRAFVKIEDGCENYCAYCIIPTARGPVRSKPIEALREELAALARSGYQGGTGGIFFQRRPSGKSPPGR